MFRPLKFLKGRKRLDVHELKRRYFAFKELLNANNEALLILTDLESRLHNPGFLTMSYLRSRCVEMSVEVYKIVRNLEMIAEKPYPQLHQVLERRVLGMERKLASTRVTEVQKFTLALEDVEPEMRDVVGGKTANLVDMKKTLNLSVPDGFVLTTLACERFYEHNNLENKTNSIKLNLEILDPESVKEASRSIQELILAGEFPEDLEKAFWGAYQDLKARCGPELRVAMRSSAIGEDSAQSSFAGLYESYLNVSEEELLHAYKKVLASKYTTRALFYKANKGIRDDEIPMCVCCMQMVEATASGVMYTQDPFQDGRVYITSGWGLGPGIVSGEISPDIVVLDKRTGDILEKRFSDQSTMLMPETEQGTCEVPVPRSQANEACLAEVDLEELFRVAHLLEDHYGGPQDVEFSIDEEHQLILLQTRFLDCGGGREAKQDPSREEISPEKILFRCPGAESASMGVGAGIAHKILGRQDMDRFPPSGVLVARKLMPEWIELLGRVKAIVVEVGSPTGHMASIAREFKVPMLVNVEGAMERIPEGEWVTLDATSRILYRDRIESLLHTDHEPSEIIKGSPVYKTLENVLNSAAPLNLTNPRDSSFRPANCRTLHDIMRFCHEESINHMFAFNDTQTFRKGEVFLLKIAVPLRIFVVDLGGGLNRPESGKREVEEEEVVSVPLQALIQGMTTEGVRWAGHIPLGFKSLVSVFANTLYDPLKSERELGARSYAIVSPNYVNFSSRLGYHFSTLDAYCGEETNSNYISFRFKGGAASPEKRKRRAEFIARVLEHHDFWVNQKEDLVNANFKKFTMPETLEQLMMLGRLMGCARQLDVAMETPEHVNHFVDLFSKGQYNFFSQTPDSNTS